MPESVKAVSASPGKQSRVVVTAASTSTFVLPKQQPQRALQLARREDVTTHFLSAYRRFWRGTIWQVFLQPVKGGFAAARNTSLCKLNTDTLQDQPGVYEFALTKGPSKRFKTYLGETSSLRRRHHAEYRGPGGGHLRDFFEAALANGCTIWRRHKYVVTKAEALAQEARFLGLYDYAWNQRCNNTSRHVRLHSCCCCCCRRVIVRQHVTVQA